MNKVASHIFRATATDSRESFQHFVLELLGRWYPERQFVFSVNPEIIALGDVQLGLQNLFARVRSERLVDAILESCIREHFDELLRGIDGRTGRAESWENAKSLVRLQLLPVEYPLADVPSVRVGPDVISVVVLPVGLTHHTVSRSSMSAWGISEELLRDRAERNLFAGSTSLPFRAFGPQSECLVLATGDGFDAARLLVPSIRYEIARLLGSPFLAAVPNRDFMIVWPADCSLELSRTIRAKTQQYFGEYPYPLSRSRYRGTVDYLEADTTWPER